MPIFLYKARDEEGRIIGGKIDAASEEDLQTRLSSIGFILTRFTIEKKNILKEDLFARFETIKLKEKYTLTIQLANTVDAGVPIMSALSSIIEACTNTKLRKVLEKIRADLNSGIALCEALKKHPGVFSNFYSSLVELGESSGNLSKVLYELAAYIKRDIETRRKIASTIMYPTILAIVAISVASFLLINIVPKFVEVFKSAGASLPLPTVILLTISDIVNKILVRYWYLTASAVVGIALGFRAIGATKKGRLKIDQIRLRLPIFGSLVRKLCIYRFTEALRLLYNSGLPIMKALKIIEEVVQNKEMENIVTALSRHLAKGEDLVSYLKLVDFFPSDVIAMIKVGEEGGKLGVVLEKVTEIYRDEINYTIERLVALLEPTIILIMGLGIGFLAMAILFPIFQLSHVASKAW